MLCLLLEISDFRFWISDLGMEINTISNLTAEISKKNNLTDLIRLCQINIQSDFSNLSK